MVKSKWLAMLIGTSLLCQPLVADALSNTPSFIHYTLDDSVIQYGYTPHFVSAADAWSHIDERIKVSNLKLNGARHDIYYVGTTRVSGLLGVCVAYDKNIFGKASPTEDFSKADFHTVVLYHNNFEKYQMNFRQRVSTTIHEIGHTLGLTHPTTAEPSVMRQGIQDLLPTAYDRFMLKQKYMVSQELPPDYPTVHVAANYESYLKVTDIDKSADLILQATPTTDFLSRDAHINRFSSGDVREFYTLTNLKIEKVLKGNLENLKKETLQVIEPIAHDAKLKINYTYEDYQPMIQGESYLIFLKKNDFGQWSIINMSLGAIPVAPPQMLLKSTSPGGENLSESTGDENTPLQDSKALFVEEARQYYLH